MQHPAEHPLYELAVRLLGHPPTTIRPLARHIALDSSGGAQAPSVDIPEGSIALLSAITASRRLDSADSPDDVQIKLYQGGTNVPLVGDGSGVPLSLLPEPGDVPLATVGVAQRASAWKGELSATTSARARVNVLFQGWLLA